MPGAAGAFFWSLGGCLGWDLGLTPAVASLDMRARMDSLKSHRLIRRLSWYGRRVTEQLNTRIIWSIVQVILAVVLVSAVLVTISESGTRPISPGGFGQSIYWSFTSILGAGEASFVTTPAGFIIRSGLVVFAVFMLAVITATIIAVIIDFLLKEGQGLGASGFRDHIVVCGWNATARDLVRELRSDDYKLPVVLIHDSERNPGGDGVYYVRGDPTNTDDLDRADIREAQAALIFPASASNEADMHSILAVMAIESVAPHVRTVAEVNNPRHVDHFRRARVDEVLVTSRLASHLLARTALYPGLSGLVTDIVSGGEGSELYRVVLPESYLGLSVDEVSARLRKEHRATLMAVSRGTTTHVNPPTDFVLQRGDDALVVAESLGALSPLRSRHRVPPPGPGGVLSPEAATEA